MDEWKEDNSITFRVRQKTPETQAERRSETDGGRELGGRRMEVGKREIQRKGRVR